MPIFPEMISSGMRLAAMFTLTLLLFGCAAGRNEYSVRIDSAAFRAPAPGATYTIAPCDADTAHEEKLFRAFTPHLAKVLAPLGYNEAKSSDSEDITLFVAFGLGVKEPSCGAAPKGPEGSLRAVPAVFTASSPVLSLPAAARVPSSGRTVPARVYHRYLMLLAADGPPYRAGGRIVLLWKVTARSAGYEPDLGKVLGAMLRALAPYVGTTGEAKVVVPAREDTGE